jgi:hypothetical protein
MIWSIWSLHILSSKTPDLQDHIYELTSNETVYRSSSPLPDKVNEPEIDWLNVESPG